MSISAPEVLFWTCPVREHTAVTWEGAIARCEICGMTSVLTKELVDRGRADQRRLDTEWFRFLAKKSREAREAPNGTVITLVSALPASILDRAAALLANAPISTEGS